MRASCWMPSTNVLCSNSRFAWLSKRSKVSGIRTRVEYPWKAEIERECWPLLKQQMVEHFQRQPIRDSTVHIRAEEWQRFVRKEDILEHGRVPALITRYGKERRACFKKEEIEEIAFDEPYGHLSHLFKGRLFRVHIGNWIEECVVTDVSTHPVDKVLYFIRFERHVPGKLTNINIPVSLSGVWGCPGYHRGGHVDLAMPTIACEVVGDKIPPPFLVDVTGLKLEDPYGTIQMKDLQHLLPADGKVRFSREYTGEEDVVMCYDPRSVPEVPLPPDWEDPNFFHRGGKYHLTYTGFWPKQTTRD